MRLQHDTWANFLNIEQWYGTLQMPNGMKGKEKCIDFWKETKLLAMTVGSQRR